jgi:hypothetical protein
VIVGAQDSRIDAALFAKLQRVQDLVRHKVMLQEARNIKQVPTVGEAAEQVSPAD